MAENSSSVSEWKNWHIALAIGAPTVLGLAGIWYIKNRRTQSKDNGGNAKASGEQAAKGENDAKSKDEKQEEEKEMTPHEKAQSAKSKGNKYFRGQVYEKAIECYTEAIAVCPPEKKQDISTYYQNRAAAHEQLKNYEAVISDCTMSLECNNRYIKALYRRARAYEYLGGENIVRCLEDITAVCILEAFEKPQSLMMAEKVLKEVGKVRAKECYKNRTATPPSAQFVKSYLMAFSNDPILQASEKPIWNNRGDTTGPIESAEGSEDVSELEKSEDEALEKEVPSKPEVTQQIIEQTTQQKTLSPYEEAVQRLSKKDYADLIPLCTKEIESGASDKHVPEALLLRSTFYLLRGEGEAAMTDFDRLLSTENIPKRLRSNALIKRGSLKMQHGHQDEALGDFAQAVREDPENSDIYHHRGQLHLLIDRVEDAARDFEKSVQLSPNFAIAHAQRCYTEYRVAMNNQSPMQLNNAMSGFEKTMNKFTDCAEAYALYGQALSDQQQFEKADENFLKASQLDPGNGNLDVHRGLLRLQWKQDIDEAARLIENALKRDDMCEFAYETLGTIEVQRGSLAKAVSLFKSAIGLAKTEVEMVHLCSLLEAAIAQNNVAKNLGIHVPSMAPEQLMA